MTKTESLTDLMTDLVTEKISHGQIDVQCVTPEKELRCLNMYLINYTGEGILNVVSGRIKSELINQCTFLASNIFNTLLRN